MKTAHWYFGSLLALSLVALAKPVVLAQNPTAPTVTAAPAAEPAKGENVIPREVLALFDDIDDIDKLRVIAPLNITPDQVDKIIALLDTTSRSQNVRLSALAVPPIKDLAAEIKAVRAKMLTGGAIPKDFDQKVVKLQAAFVKQKKAEEAKSLVTVTTGIFNLFTKTQISKAVQITRANTMLDGKPTMEGDDNAFFTYYVLNTFMSYPRMIPLLLDIKKAQQPDPVTPQPETGK